MAEKLLPCPFCGAKAERLELDDKENFGGSVICCTKCQASSAVHFDRKENLASSWNDRKWVSSRLLEDGEKIWDAPPDIPEDIWETAYDETDVFSPVYGCNEKIRFGLTEAFARAMLAERRRHKPAAESCDRCGRDIFVCDAANETDDSTYCAACAPTFEDLKADPLGFVDGDTGPMSGKRAFEIVSAHLASGGSLTDKILNRRPKGA